MTAQNLPVGIDSNGVDEANLADDVGNEPLLFLGVSADVLRVGVKRSS